ncbi:hypothetical protein DJ533_01365 (plasmid) [Acinetobacter defluvii]|uniref:Uncharacterized protein n=1 Tax=Acinetobacter defluvii TaxID=1871111 RepID=A0A2S2F8X0_9GAMM|nr:hypothetical protein [Acinetobacter defluvii]AWL27348.1 hypothetical protein DJ533_01365 [Acinetobacter defluvii]
MYKYLMMNLAINETSALPIGIRICDFNIGLYVSKKISEVPVLMAFVNYTLFKYSSYESEELEDIKTLLEEHDFKTRYDSWEISGDSFYVLGFKEITKDEFELLQKLDLLTVVDEYNYHHKLLSSHGEHKFDEYFKDFNESKEQEILKRFKDIAFNLKTDDSLNTVFAQDVIELLTTYKFGTALELIDSNHSDIRNRFYYSHTLEGDFASGAIQVIISNYKETGVKEPYTVVEPLNIEIMLEEEQCFDDEYANLLTECQYVLNLIKTDLYTNTFE